MGSGTFYAEILLLPAGRTNGSVSAYYSLSCVEVVVKLSAAIR